MHIPDSKKKKSILFHLLGKEKNATKACVMINSFETLTAWSSCNYTFKSIFFSFLLGTLLQSCSISNNETKIICGCFGPIADGARCIPCGLMFRVNQNRNTIKVTFCWEMRSAVQLERSFFRAWLVDFLITLFGHVVRLYRVSRNKLKHSNALITNTRAKKNLIFKKSY